MAKTPREILEEAGFLNESSVIHNNELYVRLSNYSGGLVKVDLTTGNGCYQPNGETDAFVSFKFADIGSILKRIDGKGDSIPFEVPQDFVFFKRFNLIPELEDYIDDFVITRHGSFITQTALAVLSAIAAPLYYSPRRKGKLNTFQLMIGPSNCGKGPYWAVADALLAVAMKGQDFTIAEPDSPQGLHASLGEQNCGLLMMSEAEDMVKAESGNSKSGILKKMMSLWASGEKMKNTRIKVGGLPTVAYPAASALLQMTTAGFENCLLSHEVAHGGFLPRCTCGYAEDVYTRDKRSELVEIPVFVRERLQKIAAPLADALDTLKRYNEENKTAPKAFHRQPLKAVAWAENAEQFFLNYEEECTTRSSFFIREGYDTLSSIHGRMSEKVLRTACLAAIWENEQSPAVTVTDLEKAIDFEVTCFKRYEDLFRIYEKSSEHERVSEAIDRLLENAGGRITIRVLRKSIRTKDKNMIDTVLNQKKKDGDISIEMYGKARCAFSPDYKMKGQQ
jgi:hypothetical protein